MGGCPHRSSDPDNRLSPAGTVARVCPGVTSGPRAESDRLAVQRPPERRHSSARPDLTLAPRTLGMWRLSWAHDDLEKLRTGGHTPALGTERYEVAKVWLVLAVLHLLPMELVARHVTMIERIMTYGRMLGSTPVSKATGPRWLMRRSMSAGPLGASMKRFHSPEPGATAAARTESRVHTTGPHPGDAL